MMNYETGLAVFLWVFYAVLGAALWYDFILPRLRDRFYRGEIRCLNRRLRKIEAMRGRLVMGGPKERYKSMRLDCEGSWIRRELRWLRKGLL